MRCEQCNYELTYMGNVSENVARFICEREQILFLIDFSEYTRKNLKLSAQKKAKRDQFTDIANGHLRF